MSGGSYDYAYRKLERFADEMRSVGGCGDYSDSNLREVFRVHLRRVAEAMKAIEWNDSGDGAKREKELIRSCLAPPWERDMEAVVMRHVDALESAAKMLRTIVGEERKEEP